MSLEYFKRRQDKLKNKLAKEGIDGMLVTNLIHIRYLCGFTGSSATLLIMHDEIFFITDGKNLFNRLNPFQFNIATAVFIYILENLLQTYNIG